jgi:hypothetical protein
MKPEAVMPALKERGLYDAIIERLNIRRQALDSWRVVPADRVVVVAELSGLAPHIIRPDIFPDSEGRTVPLSGRRTQSGQRRLEAARRGISPRRKRNGKGRNERRVAGTG